MLSSLSLVSESVLLVDICFIWDLVGSDASLLSLGSYLGPPQATSIAILLPNFFAPHVIVRVYSTSGAAVAPYNSEYSVEVSTAIIIVHSYVYNFLLASSEVQTDLLGPVAYPSFNVWTVYPAPGGKAE